MSLKARVGRHTQHDARQCQNYPQDQQVVIDLLNRIPVAGGGAGGTLKGHIASGVCSDALYHAISQFEDKYFPGQRHGFVDPGGAMLKRMEELAGRATPKPAAESKLDIVRRQVMNLDKSLNGRWPVGDRLKMDSLVADAVRYIDEYKRIELDTFSGWAVLFGTAAVTPAIHPRATVPSGVAVRMTVHHGTPVTWQDEVRTGKLPALILFQESGCAAIDPDTQVAVATLYEVAKHGGAAYRQ